MLPISAMRASALATAVLALALSGCGQSGQAPKAAAKAAVKAEWVPAAKVATAPAKVELPPGVRRTFKVGDKSVWKQGGKETAFKTAKLDGSIAEIHVSPTGCRAVVDLSSYLPVLSWRDCSGSTGSHKMEKRSGGLFPLAVGNTESWQFTGRNEKGNTWSGMRSCKVAGTANVTVPAGNFDTYHVICRERSARYDYWFAPEIGSNVISSKAPLPGKKSSRYHRELIRLEPAA